MPHQPLVSIIINNFNYQRFLERAINSALDQTYELVEVIVIDDGSSDDLRSMIKSFHPRVKVIYKENGGQASTYNVGFNASRGDLLLYLDADDSLKPEAVAECVRLWEPNVSRIHFYLEVVKGYEESRTDVIVPTSTLAEGDLREETLRYGHHVSPPASGNMYARSALEQIVPVPENEWRIGADTYFIYLTALLGKVKACRRPLGHYRVHGDNWDARFTLEPTMLRTRLEKEFLRDQMFQKFCRQHQLSYVPGSVANQIGHMKVRLASLVLEPDDHPYSNDTVLALAWRTIRTGFTGNGIPFPKKIFVVGWVAALLTAPKRFKRKIAEMALVPTRRLGIISRTMHCDKNAEFTQIELASRV